LSWLVIIQGPDAPRFLASDVIIPPTALAFVALLLDFSQYCFGYILNLRMLNSFPKNTDSLPYDTGILLYPPRLSAFYAKIWAALIATAWLVVVLAVRLVEVLRGSGDAAGS
jgi:hypothetical protein